MITNIRTISSNTGYPYFNMALEKHLFDLVNDETVILYLWQNEKTALCGYEQKIENHVRIDELIDEGGYPARRLSEGKTYFLDKGTLNYTFLCTEDNFDIDRQMQVIIKACAHCGLAVEMSDDYSLILEKALEKQPFSESDFYQYGKRRLHHGTIQISEDSFTDFSRFCPAGGSNASDTLSKSCTGLSTRYPEVTVETMRRQLIQAYEDIYTQKASSISPEELEPAIIESYEKIFSDDSWIYRDPERN